MHSATINTVSLALLALAPAGLAITTVSGVSQISDGQVQVPTAMISWTETATSNIPSSATPFDPASSGTLPYENPFTIYLTQTNSLGVITGQPSVVTSQPAVVTSQPPSATLPILSGYHYGNGTTTGSEQASPVPSTLATSTVTGSGSSSASGSRSASATFAQVTGAAVSNKVAEAGLGLVLLVLAFSIL